MFQRFQRLLASPDFSILGAALARALFDMEAPSIGLLNVGTEDMKGHDEVREAATMLNAGSGAGFRYHGFVEGDDIGKGTVDVIVTEGFTGNIALNALSLRTVRWAMCASCLFCETAIVWPSRLFTWSMT